MKPNIISLLLVAAALLPNFAYAHPGTDHPGTGMTSAEMASAEEMISAERGPHCNLATATVVIAGMDKKDDPIEEAVNHAVNSTADPVLASYFRDLYLAPIQHRTMTFVRTPDPYVDALSLALRGSVEPDSRLAC